MARLVAILQNGGYIS